VKRHMPVADLARDDRFVRISMQDRLTDPRQATKEDERPGGAVKRGPAIRIHHPNAPDAARSLMHGIFVGEVQALEGAGRTCWDFEAGSGQSTPDDPDAASRIPFELKLDMARQCWDEARHVEISVKLSEHMGSEIGEFAEQTLLYEAGCNTDPVLRLCGVNRALEGLAIDVFNTMRDYGSAVTDPVLYFCEDWMLADEVTHVKMGSDWLRRLTAKDPERQARALEFQRVVDKLFSYGGLRGDDDDSPVRLARRFRELAGFATDEIDEIAELSREATREREAMAAARLGTPAP